MYCKDLLKRQRQTKIALYCRKYKKYISLLSECKTCSDFEIKRNKPIKKVSNKRITVTQDTYNKVMQRDNCRCRLCGTSLNLQLHHVIYKSEDKLKINDVNNCIMLCVEHHALVHSNKKYWQPKLLELVEGLQR